MIILTNILLANSLSTLFHFHVYTQPSASTIIIVGVHFYFLLRVFWGIKGFVVVPMITQMCLVLFKELCPALCIVSATTRKLHSIGK